MPTYSNFYNLIRFTRSEALSTNNFQFTSRNIDVVDQVLHKLESAVFSGEAGTGSPDAPTLETDTDSGTFPSNRTVRYKITWVDEFGAESAASDESVIATPSAITRPGAPGLTVVTTGGTLKPGNYFYSLSAYTTADTIETTAGTQTYITARPTTSTNVITLTLPSTPVGATGFNIYRRGPGETQFYWLEAVDTSVATPPTTYEDDGSVSISSSRTPQNRNLTNASNSITITVSGATPVVPEGYTWKIYRTMENGNYNASFLKWVVEETYQGSGVVVPYYEDTGIAVSAGIPPTQTELSGSVNRIEALEDQLSGGRIPQVAYLLSDQTYDTTVLGLVTDMSTIEVLGGGYYTVDLFLLFSAESGENLKAQVSVADPAMGTLLVEAALYADSEDWVVSGTGGPTGLHVTGFIDATGGDEDTAYAVNVYASKGLDPATPTDTILYRGSWIRII